MNREFVYDQSPRLEIEQIKDLSGTVLYGFEYWYDCAGRRTRKLEAGTRNTYYESLRHAGSAGCSGRSAADRLTRSHHADGSWAYFHYDADGNTTSIECPSGGDAGPQGTTSYEWNQDGRMLSADVPGVATENESLRQAQGDRDAFDQRTRVVDSTGDAVLLRDGQKLIGERTSGGVWRARYSNEGPSLYSSLLSDSRGGSTRWPTFDALGSVLSWSDSSQAVTGTALWEAFGTRPASTGTLPGPFGYIGGLGYYLDQDLGLPLLSIRHYSPPRGMFVSRDPVLSEPRYQYVAGLPTWARDASGRKRRGSRPRNVVPVYEPRPRECHRGCIDSCYALYRAEGEGCVLQLGFNVLACLLGAVPLAGPFLSVIVQNFMEGLVAAETPEDVTFGQGALSVVTQVDDLLGALASAALGGIGLVAALDALRCLATAFCDASACELDRACSTYNRCAQACDDAYCVSSPRMDCWDAPYDSAEEWWHAAIASWVSSIWH